MIIRITYTARMLSHDHRILLWPKENLMCHLCGSCWFFFFCVCVFGEGGRLRDGHAPVMERYLQQTVSRANPGWRIDSSPLALTKWTLNKTGKRACLSYRDSHAPVKYSYIYFNGSIQTGSNTHGTVRSGPVTIHLEEYGKEEKFW